ALAELNNELKAHGTEGLKVLPTAINLPGAASFQILDKKGKPITDGDGTPVVFNYSPTNVTHRELVNALKDTEKRIYKEYEDFGKCRGMTEVDKKTLEVALKKEYERAEEQKPGSGFQAVKMFLQESDQAARNGNKDLACPGFDCSVENGKLVLRHYY